MNILIKVNEKIVKNTKNFTQVSGVLFLRPTYHKTLIQMFACLHEHNHNIIFNT